MPYTVLVGGARSGKSAVALQLAAESATEVTFVATARSTDPEMRERILRHVQDRPASWATVEAPLDAAAAVKGAPAQHTVVVDCVTVWLSNLVVENGLQPDEVLERVDEMIVACQAREALTILVSNEVGMGIVPQTPLGRSFRDLQGTANQRLTARADRVGLVVAGRVLDLSVSGDWIAR